MMHTETVTSHQFIDYCSLKKIEAFNGRRLCELAIIKSLRELDFDISKLGIKYDQNEHEALWSEILVVLKENRHESLFLKSLYERISQFSPDSNMFRPENMLHINGHVKTALELVELCYGIKGPLNIIEFGANEGIVSRTLQILGHNVLCTDLHHGIVTNSPEGWKAGTWIREKFIGLDSVDAFKFKEDNINNLEIFDGGINAIIMRGTGILCLGSLNTVKRTIFYRLVRKIYRKTMGQKYEEKNRFNIIKDNIIELLKILNNGGIIFAEHQNLFSGFEINKRIELLDILAADLSEKCIITYRIEKPNIVNPEWELFNITLICKKVL